jgi:hypothetical protein
MTRRERLIAELKQYAEIGADEPMRLRCDRAAASLEGGCDVTRLRDQLRIEVNNGDVSTVAFLLVQHAILEGVAEESAAEIQGKKDAAELRRMIGKLRKLQDRLDEQHDAESREASRRIELGIEHILIAAHYLEGNV